MELAIPLVALGGMYIISNQNQNKEGLTKKSNMTKETFNNMGIRTNLQERTPESTFSNYLPNTNIPPQNYPIMNNKELIDNIQEYPNPNTATNKYLSLKQPPIFCWAIWFVYISLVLFALRSK